MTSGAAETRGEATLESEHLRSPAAEAYWRVVRGIVAARLHDVVDVLEHGLGPVAADILEARGESIPPTFLRQQRLARVGELTVPYLLSSVRGACDGPMLVLKGPEVAARYPRHSRAYGDVDLLVPDPDRTQRALLAAGFVEVEDPDDRWVGIQHLNPLVRPGIPLAVEIHSVPKWPTGLRPPRFDELLERAAPSVLGVPGVLAPAPAHQALLLAAHAWAHQPLGKVRDLVDVGVFRIESDESDLSGTACAWGMRPLWRTTIDAVDAFLERRRTWPFRLWASHVFEVRGQTVLEKHLERLLAPFWGLPLGRATRGAVPTLIDEFRPAFDEGWPEKLERTAAALRRPFVPVARHRRMLGDLATRGQRRNTPRDRDR